MGAEGGQGTEGKGGTEAVARWYPTILPCRRPARGSGRRAAPRQQSHGAASRAGGWPPPPPTPRAPPPPTGPRVRAFSPPPRARRGQPQHSRGTNFAVGGTAPLTGGAGAADPSPPSRWALPVRDGASHPPRPSASPLPAVTHRLVRPAGRDARPGERGAEV